MFGPVLYSLNSRLESVSARNSRRHSQKKESRGHRLNAINDWLTTHLCSQSGCGDEDVITHVVAGGERWRKDVDTGLERPQ